jgi:hypothetical protein
MAWKNEGVTASHADIATLHSDVVIMDGLVDSITTAIESASALTITHQNLSAANDTVAAGVYEATTLHDVDGDLAVGNIKTGVVVFGFTGTYDTSATPITAGTVQTGLEGFVNGAKVTGSGTKTLSALTDTVTAGYYAATTLATVDTDLAAANIKSGTVVFGITGTYDTEAVVPIAAETVLTGKKGRVNGTTITGTMANNTGDVAAVSAHMGLTTNLHVVPAAGFTDGADDATTVDLTTVDADLVTGNILAGVTLFGVAGKSTVKDVSDTTTVANDVAAGTFFYTAAGVRTEGTHA